SRQGSIRDQCGHPAVRAADRAAGPHEAVTHWPGIGAAGRVGGSPPFPAEPPPPAPVLTIPESPVTVMGAAGFAAADRLARIPARMDQCVGADAERRCHKSACAVRVFASVRSLVRTADAARDQRAAMGRERVLPWPLEWSRRASA